jgi:two-component sensor histidine kinase
MKRRELTDGLERIIYWLPQADQPLAARFFGATAIMAVAIGLELGFGKFLGLPGLTILLFAVFLVAVVFDHGTGFYASALAIVSGYYTFGLFGYPAPTLAGTMTFSVVCAAAALFGEALRSALERSEARERASDIFLRELEHRVQNTLSMIVALLELQARSADGSEAKEALKSAANRVRIQAEAHRHLHLKEVDKVDANEYLGEICRLLEHSLQGARPITIGCDIERILIEPQKALALGLITNELVTNAVKYAFGDADKGTITVELHSDERGFVRLRVRDDGRGCPDDAPSGLGTRLLTALVKEHHGTYERVAHTKGCEVIVSLKPKRGSALVAG